MSLIMLLQIGSHWSSPVAIASAIRPDRVVVRMELGPEVLSVPGNVNEHEHSSRSFNGMAGFGNNRGSPATSCTAC